MSAYYLKATTNSITSECYALSIIPDLFSVVVVGKATGPVDGAGTQKTAAMIMLVD